MVSRGNAVLTRRSCAKCVVASVLAVACASFLLTTVPDFIVNESRHPPFVQRFLAANVHGKKASSSLGPAAVASTSTVSSSSPRSFRTCRVDRGEGDVSRRNRAIEDGARIGDGGDGGESGEGVGGADDLTPPRPQRGALVMLRSPLLGRQDRPNHWYHFAQVFITYLAPLQRRRRRMVASAAAAAPDTLVLLMPNDRWLPAFVPWTRSLMVRPRWIQVTRMKSDPWLESSMLDDVMVSRLLSQVPGCASAKSVVMFYTGSNRVSG